MHFLSLFRMRLKFPFCLLSSATPGIMQFTQLTDKLSFNILLFCLAFKIKMRIYNASPIAQQWHGIGMFSFYQKRKNEEKHIHTERKRTYVNYDFCLSDASFDVFLQHLAFMLVRGKQNDNTFPLYFYVKSCL